MRVAQGKRSAALGNEAIMNTPLSSFSAVPPLPGGTAEKEERGWSWGGYPGRQSLRAFALGYYLVASAGRQTEPRTSAMTGSQKFGRTNRLQTTPRWRLGSMAGVRGAASLIRDVGHASGCHEP